MTTLAHSHSTEKVHLGFWVYLMSDCVLFAALFATYGVLSGATFGGPSAHDLFEPLFVFVETMILLTSSFTIGLTLITARRKKKELTLALLFATFVLGLGFLAMEVYEFSHLIATDAGPARSAFLSAFFALVGTHGLHVALGAVWMLVVAAHLWVEGITNDSIRKLAILSLFWHFLDVIWIFIFTFVYLLSGIALP